ncbi:MAG: hypothetical protein H6646_12130 [Anaerolineales bacterium]|nr:hypothetical protein [Anaerolineales bacterium]MCO5247083.1 hypothetical protein [Anaerolineae bacterium]
MQAVLIYGLSLIAGLAAVYGLTSLVLNLPPTRQNLATFLLLLVIAATGLLAPALAWLHRRIPFGGRPPTRRAAFRQALLIGLALALAAWLQLVGLLDATLVLGITALVILVEVLVQSRQKLA